MSTQSTIKCPNCSTDIDVNDILYHQLEDELKQNNIAEQKKLQEATKIKEKEFKKPWKNGSYEPLVWLKENIVYKENLNAKSKLAIEVPHKIKKGDEVRVELGYYVFNPKLAKKIGLEDEKSTRYRVFVQKKFNIP